METLEVEDRHDVAVTCRITVVIGLHIDAHHLAPARLALPHGEESLPQQVSTEILMLQALRNAMDDRFFQRVVVQDRRVKKSRKHRIVLDDSLSLRSYGGPDRVHLIGSVAAERVSDGHRNSPCSMRQVCTILVRKRKV